MDLALRAGGSDMAWFDWDDSFLIGIAEIDEQHRGLVELVDQFYATMRRSTPQAGLVRLLKGMIEYTRSHFATEERWMREYSYPGLDAQIAQHTHFVEKVQNITDRFIRGELVLSIELTGFLRDWLSQHILGTDQEMGRFLIARGAR
jgi:hemerythrin